jgi:hypothetical protein
VVYRNTEWQRNLSYLRYRISRAWPRSSKTCPPPWNKTQPLSVSTNATSATWQDDVKAGPARLEEVHQKAASDKR